MTLGRKPGFNHKVISESFGHQWQWKASLLPELAVIPPFRNLFGFWELGNAPDPQDNFHIHYLSSMDSWELHSGSVSWTAGLQTSGANSICVLCPGT